MEVSWGVTSLGFVGLQFDILMGNDKGEELPGLCGIVWSEEGNLRGWNGIFEFASLSLFLLFLSPSPILSKPLYLAEVDFPLRFGKGILATPLYLTKLLTVNSNFVTTENTQASPNACHISRNCCTIAVTLSKTRPFFSFIPNPRALYNTV